MTRAALGLILSAFPAALAAQRPQDLAKVDSAQVARAAWARAGAAFRGNDLATARREVQRAATAWPTQPTYVWARAVIAAKSGDTTELHQSIAAYSAIGLGRDLRADSMIARYLVRPDFATVLAEHERNRAPLVRSRVWATLPDTTFWPEGMDVDLRTGTAYLASVKHRTIAERTRDGRVRELLPRGRANLGAMLGVRVDTLRGVLWATTSGVVQMEGYLPADSGLAALLQIRLSDGAVIRRWDLPVVPGGHVLGDLVLGQGGEVFITDSNEPVLYRLRTSVDSALERITSPLFRSLQGLAPTPDGKTLYLADYSHGLLRVDLATRAVIRLDDAPGSTSLGCDGIVWDERSGAIIAVQNGVVPARIMRFVLDGSGTRIARAELLDRNLPLADEPTIGALVGRSFVYVANSQWEKHTHDGKLPPGTVLTPPVLLILPLP